MSTSADLPRLDLGLADLAPAYDVVFCDVWGVIHNGVHHHASAVDALRQFRQGAGTVILITNAPARAAQVVARLDRLRVPRDAYDDVATSGDVTIAAIVEGGCPPVFNIGPGDEVALYREAARRGGRAPELVPVDRAELAVCIGLDETGDRPEDYDATLRRLLARNLDLVCANPDIVVEVGKDLVYCAGAIAERYAAIGGTVVQAGKPFSTIYERAFALARRVRGDVDPARTLAIGDAFATDIAGARDQGLSSLLVTSGIHRAELQIDSTTIDRAALATAMATRGMRPTAALASLSWDVGR